MKYVIEVIEVEKVPENWTDKNSWPAPGIYQAKNETYSLYHVSSETSSVNYISYPAKFLNDPYKEPGEAVSESLLLKAIAAAASRQLAV